MLYWNGTAWVNEPSAVTDNNVERISSSHDIENMDIEYESLSGDLMLVWANGNGGNGTNGVRYRTCPGGISTCTWGAVTTPPTLVSPDIPTPPITSVKRPIQSLIIIIDIFFNTCPKNLIYNIFIDLWS